jgi:hypothetical protein
MTETIVAFLRANAEQLDVDMAEALNIPLAELREEIARLAASGDVICCRVTRFIEGRKIEGISCRLSCDPPTPARGRKPGAKKDEDTEAAGSVLRHPGNERRATPLPRARSWSPALSRRFTDWRDAAQTALI